MNIQIEFTQLEEVKQELYISSTCNSCVNTCNIYSISKDTIVYCKRFKRQSKQF